MSSHVNQPESSRPGTGTPAPTPAPPRESGLQRAGRAVDNSRRIYKAICMWITGALVLFTGPEMDVPVWSSVLFFAYGVWIFRGRSHLWPVVFYLAPLVPLAGLVA